VPLEIEVVSEQANVPVDEPRLAAAAGRVLSGEGIDSGTVSIAVVDDPAIHELNRRYLSHDCPTDVLSFALEQGPAYLEGEVIVSADTAAASAARFGWSAGDELLLYVIHGCLHLCGYDDQTPAALAEMRRKEAFYLAEHGLTPRYDE
jgi:probable rRNA maturation factor